jgi:hypothetical protein
MTPRIPAARTLPNKPAVLDQVLADQASNRPRRVWMAPTAAAASVAMVAGGFAVATGLLQGGGGGAGPGLDTALTPADQPRPNTKTPPRQGGHGETEGERAIELNLGPIGSEDARAFAKACLALVEPGSEVGTVTHAVRVRGWGGHEADLTVVAEDDEGVLYGCTGQQPRPGDPAPNVDGSVVGGNADAVADDKIVINPTDETHPAAPTEGMSYQTSIELDERPDLVALNRWYRVDERVAQVRQRIIVNGRKGPWYVARAVDGFVLLRSWTDATLRLGDVVRVESQVLDHDGGLLDAPADQRGGGGLTTSPGTTRIETGTVTEDVGAPTVPFLQLQR